jgi:hypothetical protein
MTTETLPRFDDIERHADDAVTAYTYFPPTESTMRELAHIMAERPLPEVV